MTEPPGERWPGADASRPSAPRVYDYLLGGKDNFASDRALAEELVARADGYASVRDLARVNREFVLKAAQWAASMMGIAQFLDLGCGLPAKPAVHDAARMGREGARVVYVDRDPVVATHAAALMTGPGLAAVLADAADPASVLENEAAWLLDFRQPVAVILGATLSAMPADAARNAVAGYADALTPGSAVIISCASYADTGYGARMAEMFGVAGQWHNHGYEDVESFFLAAGLRIMRGRVGNLKCWPMMPEEIPPAAMLGGIGIKD